MHSENIIARKNKILGLLKAQKFQEFTEVILIFPWQVQDLGK